MKKYYKRFEHKDELYSALASVCPELDAEKSKAHTRKIAYKAFRYCTKDGTNVRIPSAKSYLRIIVSKHKLPILYRICMMNNRRIHVYTTEDIFGTAAAENTPVVDVPEVVTEEVVEKLVEEVETPDAPVFSRNYADSLYDSKSSAASKQALEDYGKLFGINLHRNKSFANMLTDLVAHVEAK